MGQKMNNPPPPDGDIEAKIHEGHLHLTALPPKPGGWGATKDIAAQDNTSLKEENQRK